MSARHPSLLDEWAREEENISMVEMSMVDTTPPPVSNISSLNSSDLTINTEASIRKHSEEDATPIRMILRTHSTSAEYHDDPDEPVHTPRQRTGFGSNVKRLFDKHTSPTRKRSRYTGHFAQGKPGWWDNQMLVDRSLRSMALFTAACALAMFIILLVYLPEFSKRLNKHSTSVGGLSGESCGTMETRNVIAHLFINLAATMILGCSNTYQQHATALKVEEIRGVMSRRGDSRVGTNSPFNIAHKLTGKKKAWAAWLLLIFTSIPIHFLANSIVGPSFLITMPSKVLYELAIVRIPFDSEILDTDDSGCWTALRTNQYVLPENLNQLDSQYNIYTLGNSTTYATALVRYTSNCTEFMNDATVNDALAEVSNSVILGSKHEQYSIGSCLLGEDVSCSLLDEQTKQCRLSIRMQAVFVLTGCLIIKAAYMILLNYRARGRPKTHCMTYGDVLAATVLDPDLKLHNECLRNPGDGYRIQVSHTCHKHCKNTIPSSTGDETGHCQTCKKYNLTDYASDLPHPTVALKHKRTLLSNLGSTGIAQMIILMFTTVVMMVVSITLIVAMKSASSAFDKVCNGDDVNAKAAWTGISEYDCDSGKAKFLETQFGTWGGFSYSAALTSLPPDNLGSELMAFAISNGAQFFYSLLYLLFVYNITLINQEHEWGQLERKRRRPRCTIAAGPCFEESYFLQLPPKILYPLMGFTSIMHWLLGQAVSTVETTYSDTTHDVEHSMYFVTYAAYPIFISTVNLIAMTFISWWAFTYRRDGYIPQMFGSVRTLCASTSELLELGTEGILWGDLGVHEDDRFRHAGFMSDTPGSIKPGPIKPGEVYCGRTPKDTKTE